MSQVAQLLRRPYAQAILINLVWINLSEVVRYFAWIRPLLRTEYANQTEVAAITPGIFVSWMIWDTVLIVAACTTYWLALLAFGNTCRTALYTATAFTVTVFGLLWLGLVNMGLVPPYFIAAALPLAWLEQTIAALLVRWVLNRSALVGQFTVQTAP